MNSMFFFNIFDDFTTPFWMMIPYDTHWRVGLLGWAATPGADVAIADRLRALR